MTGLQWFLCGILSTVTVAALRHLVVEAFHDLHPPRRRNVWRQLLEDLERHRV